MSVSLASVVVASPDQLSCELGGEAAILNMKSGRYYGLDPIGARIWSLIQKPVKVAEVRDTLLEEYEVAAEQCEAELIDLLEKLAGAGLVEVDAETAG